MPVNTYFGDVLTTGNTILRQNLTVQGAFSYFGSNLGTKTDQTGAIGSGTAWQSVYVTGSNATTMNLTSIPGPLGIATATGIGATVTVLGNVSVSNAISTTNIFVTNSNSTTLNTLAITGQAGFVGVNTGAPSGTALYVSGNLYASNALTTLGVFTTNVNVSGTSNLSTTNVTTLNTSALSASSMNVTSISNLASTNVTSLNASSALIASTLKVISTSNIASTNASTVNASSLFGTTLNVTSTSNIASTNASTVNAASIFGTNLNVTSASNLASTNVTTLNASSALSASTLNVTSASNLSTTNVTTLNVASLFGTTLNVTSASNLASTNVTTLNASSLFGTNLNVTATANVLNLVAMSNIGIGAQPGTTNLYVRGNAFFTNALVTSNLLTTNVNVSGTSNITTLIATSNIGIGAVPGTTNLYVQGNAFVTNAFTATNVVATGNVSYGENLTKRYPHLTPDSANAASIQTWISASVNASSQPTQSWWPTSQAPVYGNVISTATSNGAYNSGGVLLPSGDVLFIPNSSNLLKYSAKLRQLTVTQGLGFPGGDFGGGVLLPNGNVLFVPQNSNVGLYNPVNGTYSNSTTKASGRYSGVLTANNVVLTPSGAPSNVIVYNQVTAASTNVLAIPSPNPAPTFTNAAITSNIWSSAVWAPELGIWCAVAGYPGGVGGTLTTNTAATSPDGITWTARTLPATDYWVSVTWSPQLGLFCAVAGGYGVTGRNSQNAATSPDGITWTLRTFGGTSGQSNNPWTSVCWSPQRSLFVVVAYNTTTVQTSPDGVTWTARTSALNSNAWSSVTWSPQLGLFCAVAGVVAGQTVNQLTNNAATSSDGTTWTNRTLPKTDNWSSVCWSPEVGIFCTVGGGLTGAGGFASSNAATSSDGVTWTTRTLPVANYWSAVTWSPQLGQFMAICGGGGFRSSNAATSPDGITWTSRTLSNTWYWSDVQWSPQTGKYLFLAGNKNDNTGPTSVVTTNVLVTTTPYRATVGTALLPTGNVIFSPAGSSNVMQLDPVSLAQSNITIGSDGFTGLVLTPNGNVIGVPMSSNVITIIPSNQTASNTAINPTGNVYGSFSGGVLLPSGNVLFTPGMSANVGMFSPSLLTYSNGTVVGSNSFVKFSGSTLLPSGQVVMAPSWAGNVAVLSTYTPAPKEMCLSPYFNKF